MFLKIFTQKVVPTSLFNELFLTNLNGNLKLIVSHSTD